MTSQTECAINFSTGVGTPPGTSQSIDAGLLDEYGLAVLFLAGGLFLGGSGFHVIGRIKGKAGKDRSGKNVADGDRDLVPKPPLAYRNWSAKQHACRHNIHVNDGVLVAVGKEGHNR